MIKICLTVELLIFAISCQDRKQAGGVSEDDDCYGEYYYPGKNISLELSSPDKFALANNEFYHDMIVESPFSTGHFKVKGDTIALDDAPNSRTFTLIRNSEEILTALHVDSIPDGEKFLCWNRIFPNGEVKFAGGWRAQSAFYSSLPSKLSIHTP